MVFELNHKIMFVITDMIFLGRTWWRPEKADWKGYLLWSCRSWQS